MFNMFILKQHLLSTSKVYYMAIVRHRVHTVGVIPISEILKSVPNIKRGSRRVGRSISRNSLGMHLEIRLASGV